MKRYENLTKKELLLLIEKTPNRRLKLLLLKLLRYKHG